MFFLGDKMKNIFLFSFFLVILSSCELFLGPDPDTSPEKVLKSLWNDFNNIHAYLDFRMSQNLEYANWNDVYDKFSGKVNKNTSDDDLFDVCADMLKVLNDSHVGLYSPKDQESSYKETSRGFDLILIKKQLNGGGNDNYLNFVYGTFISNPCIGYIYIEAFKDEENLKENIGWGMAIEKIVKDLSDTKALVLDIRQNRGGDISIFDSIVSYFTAERKEYIKTCIKNGPGSNNYSSERMHAVYPSKFAYTKKIVLLTNENSVSAAERFVMALRTQNHVLHTGKATRGALSIRTTRSMINGWYYTISSERVTDMHGRIYEGIGITPDEEHIKEYGTHDEQLEYALKKAHQLSGCGESH